MLYTRGEKHKIALLPKILCFEYITKFRNLCERLVRSHPSQGETFSSDSCQEWCLARRSPKMSLFEFQAGRPNCNPLLPQLSPLQASKICKLIPFLTKGDSGFIISSDCEGWTIGNYLSRRSSSRVQHGCKCGHPFIFVLLCFLLVCIFAIIVQVAMEVSSYSILKAIYFKKTLLQNEIFRDNALFFANILLQIHSQSSIPDICQFWYTTALYLFMPVKVHQKVRNFATK